MAVAKNQMGRRATPERPRIELGDEPAIESRPRRAQERRSVSARWLAGTILTGLAGAGLIGAAMYAALDRRSTFAEAPVRASLQQREPAGDGRPTGRKADRLVKPVDIIAAKQTFRTPTTIRVGDKEVIRPRAFTRVATPLTLTTVGFRDEVPGFNPLKLMADNQNPSESAGAEPDPTEGDADVAFVTRDLAAFSGEPSANALSMEEVQAQVAEQIKVTLAAGAKPPLPLPPQLLLLRTSRAGLDPTGGLAYARPDGQIDAPFASIEVRMVPENVTIRAKAAAPAQPTQMNERLAIVRRGESLDDILRANDVPREQVRQIVAAFGMRRGEAPVREGQKVKMLFADLDGADGPMQIARISVYTDENLEATVAITDSRAFLQVEKSTTPTKPVRARAPSEDDEEEEDSGGMRLYDSVYETALKQDIPRPIIDEMIRIFANDIDFQRSVAGGDSFEAFYEENEENENRNELLYVTITTRNETFRYYRFQTPDDNLVDFYDENGRSVRKFLMRKPISIGETRSGFGMRYHPILRYAKMHTGIDWAAPIGTPIYAAGNGVVIKAAWDSGYGRRIEIQHANGYVTTYNHQSGFAKGIREGVRVKQGQVIGYLGQTGLATGPHLHYEVLVNSHFVDPMRVRLTRTREFDGKLLGEFKRERERIDALMAKAPNAQRVAARSK